MVPVLKAVLEVPTEPCHASAPVPPVAAQEVAFVLDQDSDDDCPVWMLVGDALNALTVAANGASGSTLSTTELGAPVPPAPVQVRVYVYVPGNRITPVLVPALAVPIEPFQPSAPVPPVAVQEVAPLLLHDKEAVCSTWIVLEGVMKNPVTVAGGWVGLAAVTFTDCGEPVPPSPLQINV
jgi:hypothetical protein